MEECIDKLLLISLGCILAFTKANVEELVVSLLSGSLYFVWILYRREKMDFAVDDGGFFCSRVSAAYAVFFSSAFV